MPVELFFRFSVTNCHAEAYGPTPFRLEFSAMRTFLIVCSALFLAAFSSCMPKKIPGTELDDTDDTRALIAVLQQYRSAVEAQNASAIVQMADPAFKDDGGSASPEDDLEYANLGTKLGERLAKVKDLKLELTIKRIELSEAADVARVTYTYQMSFRMPEYSGRIQAENDIKQMVLKRAGEQSWKIVSGI